MTAAVVFAVSAMGPERADPGASGAQDVTGFTGKAVGDALGLEAQSGVIRGCMHFTEFVDGTGFCLDGVTDDPLEEDLLALQIRGFERTDLLLEYAEAHRAVEQAGQDDDPQVDVLLNDLQAARDRLFEEQPLEDPSAP